MRPLVHGEIVARKERLGAHSFTFDRGSCFSLWRRIERDTNATVYFADPHAPWERGTNENTNGRLRRVFPKGFDFDTITQRDIDAVVWIMNHTKRKSPQLAYACGSIQGVMHFKMECILNA